MSVTICKQCGDKLSIIQDKYCECGAVDDVEEVICTYCNRGVEGKQDRENEQKEIKQHEYYSKIFRIATSIFSTYKRIMDFTPVTSDSVYDDIGDPDLSLSYSKHKSKNVEIDSLVNFYSHEFKNHEAFQKVIDQLRELDHFQKQYSLTVTALSSRNSRIPQLELRHLQFKYWEQRGTRQITFENVFNELFVSINSNLSFYEISTSYFNSVHDIY
jgi:hypothetical protein